MAVIVETFQLIATTADILSAPSRLAAIPRAGQMTIEIATSDADVTNFGALTVQLPNGDIPLDGVVIPSANGVIAADAVLDSDTMTVITFPVDQGGHVLLSYVENGTVVQCFLRITLNF